MTRSTIIAPSIANRIRTAARQLHARSYIGDVLTASEMNQLSAAMETWADTIDHDATRADRERFCSLGEPTLQAMIAAAHGDSRDPTDDLPFCPPREPADNGNVVRLAARTGYGARPSDQEAS